LGWAIRAAIDLDQSRLRHTLLIGWVVAEVRMEDDVQYYTRRAEEERQAAAAADTPTAERVHRVLADHYQLKAERQDVAQPQAC